MTYAFQTPEKLCFILECALSKPIYFLLLLLRCFSLSRVSLSLSL